MKSLPLAHVFQCFVYIRIRFRFSMIGRNVTAQSTGRHVGIGGEIHFPQT